MSKWQWKIPAVVAVLALLCNSAQAQDASVSKAGKGSSAVSSWSEVSPLYPKTSVDEAAKTRKAFFQEEGKESPFREEPEVAPLPDTAGEMPPLDEAYDSPSDVLTAPEPPGNAWVADVPDLGAGGYGRCARCGACGAGCSHAPCGGDNACWRESCGTGGSRGGVYGLVIGGWLDQGITVNGRLVADRFNGPVTFNDRDGEYQMNQLWLFAEREVDTGGYGWDVGGRVDFVYGTDWRFISALGLEDDWNESERFYGAALPQLYADVAVGDLTVRMGRFFTIIGYETLTAPDNFFYSHAYTMQYGEPFTHTGLLASYALGDQFSISAGFDRGWNNWEDNNHHLSFLGGAGWTSYDESMSLAFALSTGPYDDEGRLNRTMYSLVFSYQISSRLRYLLQHDYGLDNDGGFYDVVGGPIPDAEWYGINQYMVYDINRHWAAGVRVEWFCDDDGARVGGIGPPHGWSLGPNRAANQAGWAGDFTALTFGLSWKPTPRINVRPEWRWDWYSGSADDHSRWPYDFGTRKTQFTFGTDLIITF